MHRSPKSSMPRFPSISVPSTGWRAVVVLVIAVAWLGASESASDPNSPLASQILIPHEDSRARPTRRSLAKNCVVPLQCTPALYFSTVRVGPTESKHYDTFPFGKGDSSVCQIDGPSVIALGNLSANCYRVVDNVKLDFAGPGGFRKTRVVTKIPRTPFTVFGKTADGGWGGRCLRSGNYRLKMSVRGAGECVLLSTTYRFRVENAKCLQNLPPPTPSPTPIPPCANVEALSDLPNETLVALRNVTSPQSRAYRWVLVNRGRLQVDASRCIYEMTHLFAIYTAIWVIERETWQWGKREVEQYLERQLELCSWGYEMDCFRSFALTWKSAPRPIPTELFLATDLESFSARLETDLEYFSTRSSDRKRPTTKAARPLMGSFPMEFARFPRLRHLDFHNPGDRDTLLGGTLPTELGLLTQLESLHVDQQSQLSGTLPTEVGQMTSLTYLSICNTNLDGALPSELGLLTILTVLELEYVSLHGTIPSELGGLTKLSEITLRNTSLEGTIPSEMGGLTNLRLLNFEHNALQGTIPSNLGALIHLHTLYLGFNALHGTIPSEFGGLASLQLLDLGHNSLQGTIPLELGNLSTTLLDMTLNSNNFTPGALPCMAHATVMVSCDEVREDWFCLDGSCPSCDIHCNTR